MRVKAGYGYWDTTIHPIGGCFKRAYDNGKPIIKVIRKIEPPYRGCNLEVEFIDGSRGAVNSDNIDDDGGPCDNFGCGAFGLCPECK